MATYTLIPSSLTATEGVTNASNAYSDTTSIDCAETWFGFGGSAWLSGFNFPVIPSGETVSSIVVKCKIGSPMGAEMCLYGTSSGTALSQTIEPTASAATIYTFTLTESISTVLQYSNTLGIHFLDTGGDGYAEIYGAEIIITTSTPMPNKINYGGNTLIDLTGDTATASDVASGKTFHLASGIQATGTLSPSKATATTSSSTARSVDFSNLTKEPSWFVLVCSSRTSSRSAGVYSILYDGTTTYVRYAAANNGTVNSSTSHGSFSYSSGTLTLTVTSVPYFGSANWELYYL